ncbi:MAG: hemolysin family protein [Candidatus Neomarinimicrobiota bacterium]
MFDLFFSLLGVIFSILFSSLEIALISSNPFQIDVWSKQGGRLSLLSQKIIKQKEVFLFLILLGTNVSNIVATTFATLYFLMAGWSNISIIIFISIIILIFGEILPKTFIKNHANIGLVILSPLLIIMYWIFYPIVKIIIKLKWLEIYKNISEEERRQDLQSTFEQVEENESMEKEQQEMISNVFDFSKTSVYKAMTPKNEISCISIDDSLEKAMHIFIESSHSKLPVYKNNIDNIIGMIYLYDLFKGPENLDDIVREILFISYDKPILDIIPDFQKANHSLGIIIDQNGKTSGLITSEDIFEEIFGEFEDEFDDTPSISKTNSDGSILVSANMKWVEFNNNNNNLIPEGNYETIAGYIISELGRIPHVGEHLFMKIGQVVIKKASSRYIEKVLIFPNRNN